MSILECTVRGYYESSMYDQINKICKIVSHGIESDYFEELVQNNYKRKILILFDFESFKLGIIKMF